MVPMVSLLKRFDSLQMYMTCVHINVSTCEYPSIHTVRVISSVQACMSEGEGGEC